MNAGLQMNKDNNVNINFKMKNMQKLHSDIVYDTI
jgi:hypothetical protein